MRILVLGDVVGEPGVDLLYRRLRSFQKKLGVDFTVVNGENAAGRGITPRLADDLFSAGADIITLGNHSFANRQICDYLDDRQDILRPENLPSQLPGRGFTVTECQGRRVCVCNLQGQVNLDYHASSPFAAADRLFSLKEAEADIYLFDFHAEATSEKLALGYHLNGRASAVWGTHTHVPTADVRVLSGGTGYITDLGMTGGQDSVLGVRWEQSVRMFRGELTERFQSSDRDVRGQGVLFHIDDAGRCVQAERVEII